MANQGSGKERKDRFRIIFSNRCIIKLKHIDKVIKRVETDQKVFEDVTANASVHRLKHIFF